MKSGIVPVCNTLSMLFIFSLSPATAGNTCRNILTGGFHHEYSRSGAPARDRAVYAEMCASTFQLAQNALAQIHQSSGSRSVAVSLGLFSSTDNGEHPSREELSQDRFHQWKGAYCSTTSYADASRAAEFFMQEAIADPASPILEAWRACMKNREGLACWAPVSIREQGHPAKRQLAKRQRFASRGAAFFSVKKRRFEFQGRASPAPPAHGPQAGQWYLEIPLAGLDDNGIVANLPLSQEGGEYSWNVFTPGERGFPLPEPFVAH